MPEASPAGESASAGPVCPACARPLESWAGTCPYCEEDISDQLPDEAFEARLREVEAALEAHARDPESLESDRRIAGAAIPAGVWVTLVLLAGSIGLFAWGFAIRGPDGDAARGMGIIFGILFGLIFLAVFVSDRRSAFRPEEEDPARTLSRFLWALKTGRARRAYAALAPTARAQGPVRLPRFQRIAADAGAASILDPAGLKKYWGGFIRTGTGTTRTARISRIRVAERRGDDLAVVTGQIKITTYPTALIAIALCALLVAVIVILVVQKSETVELRKLLIRRGGRWFVAEGELSGLLDRMPLGG